MPARPGLAGDVRRAGVAAPTEEELPWHPAAPRPMRRKAHGHQAGAGHRGPSGARRRLRGGGGTEPLMQRQLLCGVEALEAWWLEDDGKTMENHGENIKNDWKTMGRPWKTWKTNMKNLRKLMDPSHPWLLGAISAAPHGGLTLGRELQEGAAKKSQRT